MHVRQTFARPHDATAMILWNAGTTIFEWRLLGKHFGELNFRCGPVTAYSSSELFLADQEPCSFSCNHTLIRD